MLIISQTYALVKWKKEKISIINKEFLFLQIKFQYIQSEYIQLFESRWRKYVNFSDFTELSHIPPWQKGDFAL